MSSSNEGQAVQIKCSQHYFRIKVRTNAVNTHSLTSSPYLIRSGFFLKVHINGEVGLISVSV